MTLVLPSPIRSLGRAVLHLWQWFYDYSRAKLREYGDRRRILRGKVLVAEDVYGTRFVLYPWDRPNIHSLVRHPYDVAEFQAIRQLVKGGDVAFDVGANLGIYSVLLSRLCGPTGSVWAFEPVPDTYWRLRETLALNRCENVTAVQSAICEKSGTVQMNLFEPQFAEWNTLGMPSMRAPDGTFIRPSESVSVRARTLDEFCDEERIERINFLKVDVEGFEAAVFQGAGRLLKDQRVDFICFEISKDPLKGAGIESRKVFEALEMYGYTAYRFDRTSGGFRGPVNDTTESWTNFFASCKDLSVIGETACSPLTTQIPQEKRVVGNIG